LGIQQVARLAPEVQLWAQVAERLAARAMQAEAIPQLSLQAEVRLVARCPQVERQVAGGIRQAEQPTTESQHLHNLRRRPWDEA